MSNIVNGLRVLIYLISNSCNLKQYVGLTKQTLHRRWLAHYGDAERGSIFPLHKAIILYWKEAFSIEIIDETDDYEYASQILEPRYIELHNTVAPNGYNLTVGGEGNPGYKHTEEAKRKIGEASKDPSRIGPNHPNYGRKLTDEQKEVLRKSQLGNTHCLGQKQSQETIDKRKALITGKFGANSALWKVACPDGQIILVDDRVTFCKINKLNYKAMSAATNRSQPYRGFFFLRWHKRELDA